MPKPNVDFGMLTQEETAAVANEALDQLTLDQKVKVVLKAFDEDEREELLEHLNDKGTS